MDLRPIQSSRPLRAGVAAENLTPYANVFLFGYPHVRRYSTGMHDRLETVALYLQQDEGSALFIANDLIFVPKILCYRARRRISILTGVPVDAIILTATHTHSGPMTVDYLSNRLDPAVPRTNLEYLAFVENSIVEAGCAAFRNARPAEAGLAVARAEGVGSNRHDPTGPTDSEVPVLVLRNLADRRPLACMVSYAMHPTVLQADSTLISGDFPHFTRQYLRERTALGAGCPVLYHNGASGNQSPRHVIHGNTFDEAKRLGERLGEAIAAVLPGMVFRDQLPIQVRRGVVPLQLRQLPDVGAAEAALVVARSRLDTLRAEGAPRPLIRTAECDWFGAEETLALARAAADGALEEAARACNPAEIHVIALGPWKLVFWPGEFFVEYALAVKARSPDTFVITMANGELQGYIVTPEAVERGTYEAGNAIFAAENGCTIVAVTLDLLAAGDFITA